MAKTVAEILESNDAEAAFLLLIDTSRDPDIEIPGLLENLDALEELASPWIMSAFASGGETLGRLSSDENRKILLHMVLAGLGFTTLINMFADDRTGAHRPLLLEFFLETCEDPGYFDEMLDANADKLTDDQKLKLLEAKRALG
jgi:hypothetical protein